MQFHLNFRCRDLTLPFAYNYPLQAMLYNALAGQPGGELLHDGGLYSGSRRFKLFVFGPLTAPRGHYRVCSQEKQITFSDTVSLELRTPVRNLAALFAGAFTPGTTFTLCGQPLTLADIGTTDTVIGRGSCAVRMLSPITVYTSENGRRDTKDPFSADFPRLLSQNTANKLAAFRGEERAPAESVLKLEPLAVSPKDRQITRYKGCIVIGWRGIYRLTGTPETLTFIYDCGLGSKNSAGFGLFRPLNEAEYRALAVLAEG